MEMDHLAHGHYLCTLLIPTVLLQSSPFPIFLNQCYGFQNHCIPGFGVQDSTAETEATEASASDCSFLNHLEQIRRTIRLENRLFPIQ